MIWLGQIFQGTLLGGYYALIACGLSFMVSVMGVINLAHGSFAILAAFAFWAIAEYLGVSPLVGWIVVLPAMALVGVALQRLVLDRSTRSGFLIPVLSTFGLSICIDNILFEQFGADIRSLAPYIEDLSYDSWDLGGGVFVGKLAVYIFLAAVLLLGGLQLFLSRTHLGRAIRATSADRDTVGLVGIDARRINMYATAIAMVTVGIAGAALAMRATFDPYAGAPQLIFAFEAAAIGGTGSLWGTLVGGIVLGVAQSVGAQLNPQGFLIAGHAVFLVVLVARTSLGRFTDLWRVLISAKATA
jgi:branched-chain amino acid transport system permease protein